MEIDPNGAFCVINWTKAQSHPNQGHIWNKCIDNLLREKAIFIHSNLNIRSWFTETQLVELNLLSGAIKPLEEDSTTYDTIKQM